MCLSDVGELYSFGCNRQGQLGLGHFEDSFSPQKITSLQDVEFAECGDYFVLCKTIGDDVFGWGINSYCQLGFELRDKINSPIKCEGWPENVVDIKCGDVHTLVLTQTQEVYSCGNNGCSQLGRITTVNNSTIQKIEELSQIIRIECGLSFNMCIDIDNNVFVFGHNYYGQLGLGDCSTRVTPIKNPNLSDIIDISIRGLGSFVKTSKNLIYAFGKSGYGQLGVRTSSKKEISPIQVFEDNEDIWFSNINKSKQKSARF